MFQFPFGTMHQLNLDWFLQQWEIYKQEWADAQAQIENALQGEIDRVEDAMSDLYDARDAAVQAKEDAEDAADSVVSDAAQCGADALKSEGYAVGEQDGTPVGAGSPYYQQNAKYYKVEAGTYRYLSEAYAKGEMGGSPVAPGEAGYQDNAKYYKDAADLDAAATAADRLQTAADRVQTGLDRTATGNDALATAADRLAVSQDKDDTDLLKDAANAAALRAEGWAVGEQNGTPVTSSSPYYQNNAEYYKDLAASVVLGADGAAAQAMIADAEVSATASKIHEVDEIFRYQGNLYQAIEKINIGDTITDGTNCKLIAVADDLGPLDSEQNYLDIKNGFVLSSGGINFSTGATTSSNTRIRTQGINLMNIAEGDFVIVDRPYSAILYFYNQALSSGNFIAPYPSDFKSGVIKIPSTYIGKCIGICFRNDNTPSANISSEISILKKSYFHYIRKKEEIDRTDLIIKSVFKYPFTPSYYNEQRLAVTTGGSEASTSILGSSTYTGVSKDNPIMVSCPDGYAYDVFFYSSNTQASYIEHSGRLAGTHIFNGEYHGFQYETVRFNLSTNPSSTISDPDALTANFKFCKSVPYMAGAPSGLSVIDRRFTVSVDLNWRDGTQAENPADILCILRLPTTYSQTGDPTPLIMFGHGASSQITDSLWYTTSTNFSNMINAFVSAGYAVFDVNNTRDQVDGFPDWGSLPLMTAYIKAWQYIKKHYNVEDKLYILSDSMGTCANLNMMKWYGSDVIASIMTAPRPICQLRYESATGTNKQQMAQAFDLPSTTWTGDRLKGFNHYENAVMISSKEYIPGKYPPCKIMVGLDDTSFLDETRAFYTAMANSGNYVDYREVADADHAKMSFLADAALRAEAVAWFEKFRHQSS